MGLHVNLFFLFFPLFLFLRWMGRCFEERNLNILNADTWSKSPINYSCHITCPVSSSCMVSPRPPILCTLALISSNSSSCCLKIKCQSWVSEYHRSFHDSIDESNIHHYKGQQNLLRIKLSRHKLYPFWNNWLTLFSFPAHSLNFKL